VFGLLALLVANKRVNKMNTDYESTPASLSEELSATINHESATCQWAYCSEKSVIGQQVVDNKIKKLAEPYLAEHV